MTLDDLGKFSEALEQSMHALQPPRSERYAPPSALYEHRAHIAEDGQQVAGALRGTVSALSDRSW